MKHFQFKEMRLLSIIAFSKKKLLLNLFSLWFWNYLGIFEWEKVFSYHYSLTASRSSHPSHGSRDRTSCSCLSRTRGLPGTRRHRHADPRHRARHSHPRLGGQAGQKHSLYDCTAPPWALGWLSRCLGQNLSHVVDTLTESGACLNLGWLIDQ